MKNEVSKEAIKSYSQQETLGFFNTISKLLKKFNNKRLPVFESITKEVDLEDEIFDIPNLVYKATSNHTTESTEGDEEGLSDYNECWKKLTSEDTISQEDVSCTNHISNYSLFKDTSSAKKLRSSEMKLSSQSMKDPSECHEEQNCNEFSLFSNDFFSVNFNHNQDSLFVAQDIWQQIDKINFMTEKLGKW